LFLVFCLIFSTVLLFIISLAYYQQGNMLIIHVGFAAYHKTITDRRKQMAAKRMMLAGMLIVTAIVCTIAMGQAVPIAEKGPLYSLIKKISVGGDGGWDYLFVDSAAARCYVSHQSHVVVLDIVQDKVIGDIANTPGVHGVAMAYGLNKGYISNGGDNSVTVFDPGTLKETGRIKVGDRPDAILFDPVTKRVFTFNGASSDTTIIDTATDKVVGTIALGGKPEFAVSDEKGNVYVNIEDTSEIAVIDAQKLTVTKRWLLAPAESPSGLAIDRKNQRLFSVCSNGKMAISDYAAGKVIATPAIGNGPDAAEFDSETGLIFSSNGRDGTLTIIREETPGLFKVVDTVTTAPMARTMALDPKTHRIYLSTAKPKAPAPGETPAQGRRRSFEQDPFEVLVLGPVTK
jgi:YVTN family beta-propeller protein